MAKACVAIGNAAELKSTSLREWVFILDTVYYRSVRYDDIALAICRSVSGRR